MSANPTNPTNPEFFEQWLKAFGLPVDPRTRYYTVLEWNLLTEDEHRQVMQHTLSFAADNRKRERPKQPNYYLHDRWWQPATEYPEPPQFLEGRQVDEARRCGYHIVQVRVLTADGPRYRLVTSDEAKRCGLCVTRDF